MQPPKHHLNKPVSVQVILAREESAPPKCEPVSWLLLTTLPLLSFDDVVSCLRWYSYRWLIERYHYVLKIGCRLEQLQLETADRIHRANLQSVIFVLLKRLANHILMGEDSNNSTHSFDRHQEYSKLMKIQQYKFPLVIILAGIFFSLYLQLKIPDGVFFSGDAGLKALLAQQFSAGNFRFDLDVPADQWVRDL